MTNMKKVAELADVSISTVSRVLSHKEYYVKESTRDRVMEAVKKANYLPKSTNKTLNDEARHTIGLLVPNIENEMFPPIIKGAEGFLRKKGYNIILCNIGDDLAIEEYYINKLRKNIVDGFIICSMLSNSESIRELIRDGFPVVLVSRYYGEKCNAVIIDNYKAGYDATNYLLRTGKRKIAVVLGRKEVNVYEQRLEGYKMAIKEAKIEYDEDLIIHETSGDSGLYQSITELLKRDSTIDAIFATNDHKAIVTLKVINDLGIRVPEDISVLGFDNIKLSTMLNPSLSTVSQPFYEMGKLAARKLYNVINEEDFVEPRVDVLNTEIIIRKSTK